MSSFAANAVGVIAALCSMTSFGPQIGKIIQTRDASAVSLKTYSLTVTGFIFWTAYGAMIRSWPVMAANAVCLGMSGTVLFLKWRWSRKRA